MSDFPDVKIGPLTLWATIKYDVEVRSNGDIEVAKQDFNEAMELLRQQGGAEVTWEEGEKT